ncbi:hypothetical protein [Streptomyces sp. NBC_00582]|uniref:hypothetical protein n=1 Tax=Streptomyces sp. NBC_00582 TaxID=2975783 RepID=UPI002E809D98|nr:hypothetical protein [Streptomyces sp. NBC_00582]WUB68587.1 hypothetical protein OG852_50710 [Streptomyces sp. NBC_00582]
MRERVGDAGELRRRNKRSRGAEQRSRAEQSDGGMELDTDTREDGWHAIVERVRQWVGFGVAVEGSG